MAWSDPGDFTSGQILTAAQMDSIREAMFFGQATFTNEAARDAAIPATGIALQEGMRAYLTASTVATATGTTTSIPSGITTIYNGSAWVCVTEVGARSTTSGTTTTGFVTTLTGDATAISGTLSTGTTALVSIDAICTHSAGGNAAQISFSVSGATTLAASDANGANITLDTSYTGTISRSFVITGLTAGTNTFTLNYKTGNPTLTFTSRSLVVKGIA